MTTVRPLTQDDVRRLTVTTEPWLSCDDCFDGVDVFVEEVLSGSTPVSEDFRVHLLGCSVCPLSQPCRGRGCRCTHRGCRSLKSCGIGRRCANPVHPATSQNACEIG